MNKQVVVSVVAIDFGGEPLRDRVTFVVGGSGIANRTYPLADVGKVCTAGKYEIRLTRADAVEATFVVTRR